MSTVCLFFLIYEAWSAWSYRRREIDLFWKCLTISTSFFPELLPSNVWWLWWQITCHACAWTHGRRHEHTGTFTHHHFTVSHCDAVSDLAFVWLTGPNGTPWTSWSSWCKCKYITSSFLAMKCFKAVSMGRWLGSISTCTTSLHHHKITAL